MSWERVADLRVVAKQQKYVKVFTGNFQFNFRAPSKKPLFCHPGMTKNSRQISKYLENEKSF